MQYAIIQKKEDKMLQDLDITHEGPIKSEPGAGVDLGYIAPSQLPYRITVEMDTMTNDHLNRAWVQMNFHWQNTGLLGWVEYAHTSPITPEPPVPPTQEPPTEGIQYNITFRGTITLTPK